MIGVYAVNATWMHVMQDEDSNTNSYEPNSS